MAKESQPSGKTAELIKKELGIEKGAGNREAPAGDLSMEAAVKIARSKAPSMLANDLNAATREVLGTCVSMGVTVEGKKAREAQRELAEGKYDELLR